MRPVCRPCSSTNHGIAIQCPPEQSTEIRLSANRAHEPSVLVVHSWGLPLKLRSAAPLLAAGGQGASFMVVVTLCQPSVTSCRFNCRPQVVIHSPTLQYTPGRQLVVYVRWRMSTSGMAFWLFGERGNRYSHGAIGRRCIVVWYRSNIVGWLNYVRSFTMAWHNNSMPGCLVITNEPQMSMPVNGYVRLNGRRWYRSGEIRRTA